MNDGLVVLEDVALFKSLFVNPKNIENITVAEDNEDVHEYNKWAKIYDLPLIKTTIKSVDHKKNQEEWFISDKFRTIDVSTYLFGLCKCDEELQRVKEELKEYEDRNLINLLKYLMYLVEVMKENNVVWGVGRGSSVSSYVLYLIGVHKINSLKYKLNISEFLK